MTISEKLKEKLMFPLFLILLLVTAAAPAQSTFENLLQFADTSRMLRNASVSIYAINTSDGKILINKTGNRVLAPASNLKVVTSAAGLELLGSDFRYKTSFSFSGTISSAGELNGDLIIVPSGDPTFGSTFIDSVLSLSQIIDSIISVIEQSGIKRIIGNIRIDLSEFTIQQIPDYWSYIDIGNYYGTGVHKFTVHDNLYFLYFKPGAKSGDQAEVLRTEPAYSGLSFINRMRTGKEGSGDNGYIYPLPGREEYMLQGSIPAGVEEFDIKGSVPDPAVAFTDLFLKEMNKKGISFRGEVRYDSAETDYGKLTPLTDFYSPPLKNIVRIINKRSNNLYTEQVLATLGSRNGKGGTEEGIAVVDSFLKANYIFTESLRLQDGSGLSRSNMISAKTIAGLLNYMALKGKSFTDYYASFPIAGDTLDLGGFKRFGIGTPIAKNARIKSGTINGVRSFSGYIHNKKGELIAFSFIVNNYSGRSADVDGWYRELLLLLAD